MSVPEKLAAALMDRYRIERELGAGGMATVYLARDLRHERQVALKVLRPELAAVMGGERFLTEIRTTAQLQHPHILPLFDSGEAAGLLFYVMPYIEGESLRDRLDREKQLPVAEAVAIATKVAGALQAAHDKGIVHRDIKPANILLAGGEPLVADFGIALAVQNAGGGRLTETGLSLGTPYYMSPEQATADRDPDARSDVYSLASVLYEMLTGEPPFTGGSAQAVLGRILTQPAPSVTAERPSVPSHVSAVIQKALSKLPADRVENAAVFAAALNDPARAAGMVSSEAAGVGSRPSGPIRRLARFAPWAVAAVAVGWAVSGTLRSRATPPPRPVRFALAPTGADGVRAVGGLEVSPDGRGVVFEGTRQGRTKLYWRSFGGLDLHALPGTDGVMQETISPDGRWVAFAADSTVKRVSLEGGAPLLMAHTPNLPIGMAWSADKGLVFGMLAFDGRNNGLTGVQVGDTTIHTFTKPPNGFDGDAWGMNHEPWALPGGGQVLYTDFSSKRQGAALGLASLSKGTTRILDLGGSTLRAHFGIVGVANGVLLFIDSGDHLMAVHWDASGARTVGDPVSVPGAPSGIGAASLGGDGTLAMTVGAETYDLELVDDRGNLLRKLDPGPLDYVIPRFSPNGHRAALAGGPFQGTKELWVYNFETNLLSQLGIGFAPRFALWSPDGRRIVAGTNWRGPDRMKSGLWSRAADASDKPSQVMPWRQSLGRIAGGDWAPDGSTVALVLDRGPDPMVARYDIVLAHPKADTTVVPFATGPAQEVAPRFSPDGKWLAYASNESGRFQVYVRPFPGPGPRIQISQDGGGQPVWSGDGRRLFYRADRAIMAANLQRGSTGTLAITGRERLFEGDFLGNMGSPVATYDVRPDGHAFLVERSLTPDTGEVIVWMNWLDGLKADWGTGTNSGTGSDR
jgi:serine/threonine-protein kinase